MTELYLIAHKVRNEPAFDVATRIECSICGGQGYEINNCDLEVTCHECDSLGYWWIIPTSGHRAYPWWNAPIVEVCDQIMIGECRNPQAPGPMPPNLPDHYIHREAPKVSLIDALGLKSKPKPALPPIIRRI